MSVRSQWVLVASLNALVAGLGILVAPSDAVAALAALTLVFGLAIAHALHMARDPHMLDRYGKR